MDTPTARTRLEIGLAEITAKRVRWDRRQDYYDGEQDLPFAPLGVNVEYEALQRMAIANWIKLAMDAPPQRLHAKGIRTGISEAADKTVWSYWQANKMDARERRPFTELMCHSRGVVSVWPNDVNPAKPVIRPETDRSVHIEPDPSDPYTGLWCVKHWAERQSAGAASLLVLPPSMPNPVGPKQVAVVYDRNSWARFESTTGDTTVGGWRFVAEGAHPLQDLPFTPYDSQPGRVGPNARKSSLAMLMPHQDAINTIRFNVLLAMQFSAFRQRVFTGYDPTLRDDKGQVVWKKDSEGTVLLDTQGQPIPVLVSPGRVGVDRALVFPGSDTKVFDLPESNLSNYVTVLQEFLTQFFATAQVPPQYLLTQMVNISGDALTAAESTLQSLIEDLQVTCGESHEQVLRLASRAAGGPEIPESAEVVWGDTEARSFSAIVDGIGKLISSGFPRQAAFEMIPGATPPKVERWMQLRSQEVAAEAAQPAPGAPAPTNQPAA